MLVAFIWFYCEFRKHPGRVSDESFELKYQNLSNIKLKWYIVSQPGSGAIVSVLGMRTEQTQARYR